MAKPNIKPLMEQLYADFLALKQQSSPLLQCMGVLVLDGFEEYRFLIKSGVRPIITYTEPVEVHYAGGHVGISSSVPKTNHQGAIQVIETEAGHAQMLAEGIALQGGITNAWYYDGRIDNFSRVYRLHDVALTFESTEFDSESKSQVMIINGQMSYNYFGTFVDAKSGNLTTNAGQNQQVAQVQQGMLQKVQNTLNTVNSFANLAGQAVGLANSVGSLFGRRA